MDYDLVKILKPWTSRLLTVCLRNRFDDKEEELLAKYLLLIFLCFEIGIFSSRDKTLGIDGLTLTSLMHCKANKKDIITLVSEGTEPQA